ncbi:hypothetical protein KGF51_10105 [Clostridioides sp. ZZV14-6045]|uniref:hypothetical protein n=1 Tax=Clostridioides sp. ZZV14-6045 TaxID=2811489 RepID=UPI001D1211F5|nr:hypothetical protein [Clostridioides sp. ZZV14-6045]
MKEIYKIGDVVDYNYIKDNSVKAIVKKIEEEGVLIEILICNKKSEKILQEDRMVSYKEITPVKKSI